MPVSTKCERFVRGNRMPGTNPAVITGPAGTSSFLTGSIFRFSPSREWAPSRVMSPGSANTTRSGASVPAARTNA